MPDFSRRTVVRGTAWTVPVVAIAASVPAFAASQQRIIIDFANACATTGGTNKGCGTDKALQIPLTVDNSLGMTAITFQITSMFTANGNIVPTQAGPGVAVGVDRIAATNAGFASQSVCNTPSVPISPATPAACQSGATANGYVTVAAGKVGYFFIVAPSTGSASSFSATINARLLDASCNVIAGSAQPYSQSAIPSGNCR